MHAPTTSHGSLWQADRRALTVGLILTITLVAFEALAVSTIMPIVAAELGGDDFFQRGDGRFAISTRNTNQF